MRRFLCAPACWIALVCCFAWGLAGCTSKPVGDMIVGTWEVTKSGSYMPEGAILEFSKNGKLKMSYTIDGKENPTDWTYIVDGDKLNWAGTMFDPEVKQTYQAKEVLKIKKLTRTELVTESATGESGIVTGFTYQSNIPIKSVLIARPLRHGQKTFELVVDKQTFPLVAGTRFDFRSIFPEGVTAYTIQGINESEGLVYEPGEIQRSQTPRPVAPGPVGIHHRGSFPTRATPMEENQRPEVMMVPILKQYPTEYKRK